MLAWEVNSGRATFLASVLTLRVRGLSLCYNPFMDVIKFSQKTKQEADSLLEYGNVLAVLQKYGKVVVTGSYKYDLMWGPDIDLVVLTNKPEESAFNALKDFIEQRNFQKYQLGILLNSRARTGRQASSWCSNTNLKVTGGK